MSLTIKISTLSSFCLLGLLMLSSCKKDELNFENIEYGINPQFGVPITNATIKAQKVIDNFDDQGIVVTADNDALSLTYSDSLQTIGIADYLSFPDQETQTTLDLTAVEIDNLFASGSFTLNDEEAFSFDTDEGDELDSIRFESGNITLNIESEGNIPISGFVKLLGADGNEAITLNFSDNTAPIEIQNSVDFQNLLLNLQDGSGASNSFKVEYEVTFSVEEGNTYNTGSINVFFSLNDLKIKTVAGHIVPRTLPYNDLAVEIKLFDDGFDGSFEIADPRLNLYFKNGFGLGVGVEIESLYGLNANNDIFEIPGSGITDLPVIEPAPQLGLIQNSTITISNDISTPTISELLSFEPNLISGDFALTINPNNEDHVFISSENELGISFEAELPIYGSISDFTLVDTVESDLGDFVEESNRNNEIDSLLLKLFVKNGLPLDVGMQMIFTDSDFQAIDSLFTNPEFIFTSAPVNYSVPESDPDYGRSIGKTEGQLEVRFERDRIPPLENATHLIIRVFGATTNNGAEHIRMFADDEFDFNLAAKASLNFDEN